MDVVDENVCSRLRQLIARDEFPFAACAKCISQEFRRTVDVILEDRGLVDGREVTVDGR